MNIRTQKGKKVPALLLSHQFHFIIMKKTFLCPGKSGFFLSGIRLRKIIYIFHSSFNTYSYLKKSRLYLIRPSKMKMLKFPTKLISGIRRAYLDYREFRLNIEETKTTIRKIVAGLLQG